MSRYCSICLALLMVALTGCANPTGCISGCASMENAEPAKLTAQEEEGIRNKSLVKVQQWTVHTGKNYPSELIDNQLELGAPKLSARNYPRGVFVCAHSNLECGPIISVYVGSLLSQKYGFKIVQNPAEADGLFFFDASHFSGIAEYNLVTRLDAALRAQGVKTGDDLSKVTINGFILIDAPQRWNDTQVSTVNLVTVDPAKAIPFEGYGLVKRSAGALWYKHGDMTPRYSINGIYSGGVNPRRAFIPLFIESMNELLARTFEPTLGKK